MIYESVWSYSLICLGTLRLAFSDTLSSPNTPRLAVSSDYRIYTVKTIYRYVAVSPAIKTTVYFCGSWTWAVWPQKFGQNFELFRPIWKQFTGPRVHVWPGYRRACKFEKNTAQSCRAYDSQGFRTNLILDDIQQIQTICFGISTIASAFFRNFSHSFHFCFNFNQNLLFFKEIATKVYWSFRFCSI